MSDQTLVDRRIGRERSTWTGRQLAILAAVSLASFLEPLDITLVTVSLPDIGRSLGASFAELQWVVNAYTLAFAALLLTAGSLGDLLGRRRVFLAGLVLFGAMSLVGGLASDPLMLVVSRGLKGIGAAFTFANAMALLVQEFKGRQRTAVFGIWGSLIGGGLGLGPLIGGFVADAFGWRWIFLGLVPLVAVAFALSLVYVRESRDPEAREVDLAGLATFTAAFFLLIFALVQGNEAGWGSPLIVGALIGATVLFPLFVVAERAQDRPMLDLKLFRDPTFSSASLVTAVHTGTFAFLFYLPLYFQGVLGYSASGAGLAMVPFTGALVLTGYLGGRVAQLVPARLMLGGALVVVAGGLGWLALAVGPNAGFASLAGGLVAMGLGLGSINGEMSNVAIGVVPDERAGMASGVNNTARQVGFGIFTAGLGIVFAVSVSSRLAWLTEANLGAPGEHATGLSARVVRGDLGGAAGALPPGARRAFLEAARESFTGGMSTILLLTAAVVLVTAVVALLAVRDPKTGGRSG